MQSLTRSSRIQEFFSGKTVFLTGSTGFLGKVLLEKLLRSCPNVQRVFLLVRDKEGDTPSDRLKAMVQNQAFSRLKLCEPGFAGRLRVVHGDLTSPRLGLSQDDVSELSQTVDIVIHSAATVNFTETLDVAVATNVAATHELCLLAQGMKRLKAFMHVSTAYTNCELDWIPERVCPSPVSPETLLNMTDEQLRDESPSLLGPKPNTYILTKCAAEEIINNFKTSLPVAILRPAVVSSSVSDPFPGWLESGQGVTGVITSCAVGLLRTVPAKVDGTANLVPVDWTANSIIALAYSVALSADLWKDRMPVVNMVPDSTNCLTWDHFKELMVTGSRANPPLRCHWYPVCFLSSCPLSRAMLTALLHDLPCRLQDLHAALTGQSTRLRRHYNNLDKYIGAISYFSSRHFVFEERNAALLWKQLEPLDQQLFPFNMTEMQWQQHMSDYVLGCRHYLLKESPHTLDKARQRLRRLYFIHETVKSAAVALVIAVTCAFVCLVITCRNPPRTSSDDDSTDKIFQNLHKD